VVSHDLGLAKFVRVDGSLLPSVADEAIEIDPRSADVLEGYWRESITIVIYGAGNSAHPGNWFTQWFQTGEFET